MLMLTESELFDAIDGFMAHDHGSADSGIHYPELRERVFQKLHEIAEDGRTNCQMYSKKFDALMRKYIERYYFSKVGVKAGYGFEDLSRFVRWIEEQMGKT
jgi:hypothetical protein